MPHAEFVDGVWRSLIDTPLGEMAVTPGTYHAPDEATAIAVANAAQAAYDAGRAGVGTTIDQGEPVDA